MDTTTYNQKYKTFAMNSNVPSWNIFKEYHVKAGGKNSIIKYNEYLDYWLKVHDKSLKGLCFPIPIPLPLGYGFEEDMIALDAIIESQNY